MVGVAAGLSLVGLAAAAVPNYQLVGQFAKPAGAWDVRPDGRLVALAGTTVVVQTAVNGPSYAPVGSVPAGSVNLAGGGASFVALSPDGSTLAFGDNVFSAAGRTHLLSTAALTVAGPTPTASVVAPNYDAKWASNSTLYVAGAGGPTPVVTRVTAGPTPTATTVIDQIGDGSGGVALRGARLYTAIGYDSSFVTDGTIRSFDLTALGAAASPVAFSTGQLHGQILSAASLDFDGLGNLIVGGFGSLAVVDLQTMQRVDLAPVGASGFYGGRFNAATGEILVTDFTDGRVFRYAVPAPGGAAVAAVGLATLARRRRRA